MKSAIVALAVVACAVACNDAGEGRVEFTTWGEDYIESEIPAEDFADGWSVRYSKFLVVIGNVKVADASGAVAAEMTGAKLYDFTKPGVKPVVTFAGLEAKTWDRVSYEIAPARNDVEPVDATDADKASMIGGGYSIFVEGTASKGAEQKKFAWGMKTSTIYDRCEGELSAKSTVGVVITNGGTDRPQLTIHGDHLFYDDLQAGDAKLRFDSFARADADGDGNVTLDELAAIKLASIPKENGPYGTGSASGIHDLAAFVTALSRTIGHFRGEGECFAKVQ